MRKNKEYSSIYGKSEHMSSDKKYAKIPFYQHTLFMMFLNQ